MDNLVCNSSLRALGVEGERITWPWPIDQSYGRVYSLSGETLFIGTLPRRQPVAINFGSSYGTAKSSSNCAGAGGLADLDN